MALAARRSDRISELAKRISDDGGRAVAIETDITDEAQARAFVEGAKQELGSLDGLINNAGVMLLGPIEGADTDDWRRMIEVNCLGLLYCTHAALPIMREQGGGQIVNLSSVAGRQAAFGSGVYNMTKWGVNGFSESLRQEALNHDIRVTIIEPGFVATELQGHNAKNEFVMKATEAMREEIGRTLDAQDIANAIVYALAQPQHVSINEVLVRPTKQRR